MEPTIAAVSTFTSDHYPHLAHVVLETSDQVTGLGETYHNPRAVSEYIHSVLAPLLLGHEASNIAEAVRRIGSRFDGGNVAGGTANIEASAASAVDIALWDLRGRTLGLPLADLLGGRVRSAIPAYNTCVGYGFHPQPGTSPTAQRTSQFGLGGPSTGPFEDFDAMWQRPAELARELIDEGYTAMKLFTFNRAARETQGTYISRSQLNEALAPLRAIRDSVGGDIDLMMDLNFMWSLAAGSRIVSALEEFELLWIEDPLWWGARRHHRVLRDLTRTPIAAFDYAAGAEPYLRLIEDGGISILRLDPQWCGGVSEALRIASIARAVGISVVFHDCTGPVQFATSTHLALHVSNAMLQESARAYWRCVYPLIADGCPVFAHGSATPSSGPGHGVTLTSDYLSSPGVCERRSAA